MAARVSVPVLCDAFGNYFPGGALSTISTESSVFGATTRPGPPPYFETTDVLQVSDPQIGTLFLLMTLEEYQTAVKAANGGSGGDQDLESVLTRGYTAENKSIQLTEAGAIVDGMGKGRVYVQSDNSDPSGSGAHSVEIKTTGDGGLNALIITGPDGAVTLKADTSLPNMALTLPAKTGTLATLDDIHETSPLSADLNAANFRITNLGTPVGAMDAATRAYVDAVAASLSWKTAVRLATANGTPLPTNVYLNGTAGVGATLTGTANGALSVDGVAVVATDRVLVRSEAAAANNGIYVVTAAGTVGTPYVLTRATDNDQFGELVSAAVNASEGATNANKAYTQVTPAPITVGTTSLVWNLFLNTILAPGTGARISGNLIYIRLSEGVAGGQTVKGGTNADDTLTVQGSISTDPRVTTAPAVIINSAGSLGDSAAAQTHLSIPITVAQSGTAGYSAVKISVTETSVGSGTKNLLELSAGASGTTKKLEIANTGTVTMADGANIITGSGTGTQIGRSSSKLSFFGAPPVVQQTGDVLLALQALGLGTALTITAPAGSGGLLNVRILTAGTTSYTPTAGTNTIVATLIGGGGGGGGAKQNGSGFMGVGGGGGMGSITTVLASAPAGPYTCVVGTGGAGGVGATPADGSSGNGTSLTIGATTYTANGGGGGHNGPVTSSVITFIAGGVGGAAGSGLMAIAGAAGERAFTSGSVPKGYSGSGADCLPYGSGGQGALSNSPGVSGTGFGSGGGGGFANGSTNQNGGNGAPGVIIIYEYR